MNNPLVPMIGLGYHGTVTPPVIRRNVLEDPSWYTAYTPYQPEISQGRLEALLNFQTMVSDLTGLGTANASLLDEGTAAAEAMTLVRRVKPKQAEGPFVVDADALPQTIAVVRTRAEAMGIDVVVADLADGLPDGLEARAACWCSTPAPPAASSTRVPVIEQVHERGGLAVVAADLLALTLLESPGELGADVAVGSTPALRRTPLLRRPARRLHVRARRPRAAPARPPRRRLGRLGRASGVPPLAADPRAAHPPRPGDLQHLHRAGAARRGRLDVRRPPRSRGPDARSRGPPTCRPPRSPTRLRDGGVEVVHDAFFDTVTGPGAGSRRRRSTAAARAAGRARAARRRRPRRA